LKEKKKTGGPTHSIHIQASLVFPRKKWQESTPRYSYILLDNSMGEGRRERDKRNKGKPSM